MLSGKVMIVSSLPKQAKPCIKMQKKRTNKAGIKRELEVIELDHKIRWNFLCYDGAFGSAVGC